MYNDLIEKEAAQAGETAESYLSRCCWLVAGRLTWR